MQANRYIMFLNMASTAQRKGDLNSARMFYKKAVEIKPNDMIACGWLGTIEAAFGNFVEAERLLQIAIAGEDANFLVNYGNVLAATDRPLEAISVYERLLQKKPRTLVALLNAAECYQRAGLADKALLSAERALAIDANQAEGWNVHGNALNDLKRYREALVSFDRAVSIRVDFAGAWFNRGNVLSKLKLHEESARSYLKAHQLDGSLGFSFGRAHHEMMQACNWADYDKYVERINSGILKGERVAEPFGYQGIADSELLLQKCAEIYCTHRYPKRNSPAKKHSHAHRKIRLGYLCGEFYSQATSVLMAGIWESHNKERFELFGLDNGDADNSVIRKRIEGAFDNLIPIKNLSDEDAAKFIEEREIDILINLNGYFGAARQGVFARRPSPVQVNYLGFPGTLGSDYMDYLIADRTVIPESSRDHYCEKIIYMPFCYQANDNRRMISTTNFDRSDFGLPADAVVFCCFNNSYKITPEIFHTWLDILSEVENSCLWLLEDNPEAKSNLQIVARKRLITPDRIIFSSRVSLEDHLARHKLADVFLDTSPYNAHTTASDALWAGLPIVTLAGTTFPGRVCASLLKAVGLDDLITHSINDYKSLAISLARHPQTIRSYKQRLLENRLNVPLFNTSAFTRSLERAFEVMHYRHEVGLRPDHLDLEVG